MVHGKTHRIFFHGPPTHFWIDGQQYEVQIDAPPEKLDLNGENIEFRIDSKANKVFVNSEPVCNFGGPKNLVKLGSKLHEIMFDPPTKRIIIDNKVCELRLGGQYPVVVINGVEHGIRFDGPPRDIRIDDKPFEVPVDLARRVRIRNRAHHIAFGGPGHEVIIDGKWYEIKFGGPEKCIRLGPKRYRIKLDGPPPEVNITFVSGSASVLKNYCVQTCHQAVKLMLMDYLFVVFLQYQSN